MGKLVIPSEYQGLPAVTAEQMKEIDRRAQSEFGISSLTLMENAGRLAAEEVVRFLESRFPSPHARRMAVACGRGNNGGDGLVAARYLKEKGIPVKVFIAAAKTDSGYGPEVRENLDRLQTAGVSAEVVEKDLGPFQAACGEAVCLLDALLGTGSSGKPAGTAHKMIQVMMKSKKPIVALDVPSGLHPDTGYHSGVFITAALTLTLGFPKRGLLASHVQKNVGELKVLDIGFPRKLWPNPL